MAINPDHTLNIIMDQAQQLINEFNDSQRHTYIATAIYTQLMNYRNMSNEHPDNCIEDYDMYEIIALLNEQLRNAIQDTEYRSTILSFFHSSGLYREWLELMIDTCLNSCNYPIHNPAHAQ